ncbi:hypothetical protein FBY33_2669 [Arthrobacter sp. SLBN-112]|uniref:hypothetical protein n=1 Tax=Arthrobacter sp. SLBN-112 TaxID=2768452 RepID=UPI0011539750|nr:hypothetical protein [Arthrobacter sp. SLBN-112]TQJ40602.1 hypothetical protein FBY33_2669 [Arthrobacter sp. SLBN-112]
MKNPFFGVLSEAAKVAVAVWVVLWAEPFLESSMPSIDAGWRYLLSAIFTAVVLEVLLQIVFGWPRVDVQWGVKGEDAPIANALVARVTKRKPDSQVFSLRISAPSGGWLGYQILKLWMLIGVKLQIRIERASVVPSVENSPKVNGLPTVKSDDESKGFCIDLGRAPRRPGQWHWAEVSWRDEATPNGIEINIDYVLHHKNAILRSLLFIFVRKSSNARHFQVVGT